jgi:hypothetical protein
MTSTNRSLVIAGAAVLFSLSLAACGGAPTNASEKDFCERVNQKAGEEFSEAFADGDWDKIAEITKEHAEEAEEVGTPEGIPDDAREGWELQIDAAKNFDGDEIEKAFKESLANPDEAPEDPFTANLSKDDKEKVEAYTEYENKTC